MHRAGPREKIYYKPENVKAAIVTCGGLCPGLNDVIRQVHLMWNIAFGNDIITVFAITNIH